MEVIEVCLRFNRNFINTVSFIASVIIVMVFSIGIDSIKNVPIDADEQEKSTSVVLVNKEIENAYTKEENKATNEVANKVDDNFTDSTEDEVNEFDWYIEIPKIKLYAPIEEGIDDEVLNRSVGHFENTSRRNGNCGFAAHNRGYRVNYFAKLKELEKGDRIFYFVDDKKYEYEVTEVTIIYETDWSMLNDTEDNRITLITCVENREEYRLCVQGILKEL